MIRREYLPLGGVSAPAVRGTSHLFFGLTGTFVVKTFPW